MAMFKLKLFIYGHTGRSKAAIKRVKTICEEKLSGEYELAVIDVLENPELAERFNVLGTPTLVRELPHPIKLILGDLWDRDKVIFGLQLENGDS